MAGLDDISTEMNAGNLYEEKIVSDRKIGTIRVMTPIKDDGTRDESRKTLFIGEAQIMTRMGGLPINFEIPAENLAEAVKGYGEAAKKGVEDTLAKLEDLRERAAHRIVTPGTEGFQVPPAPGGASGQGGSGIIL
ncbi:MAG: hypothetical protein MR009_08780 [Sutterellaceae bacterium]|nr:hypothetical protein [Sutterellaceae bacterium]MDD7441025.1 hypothetical protein [Sutterellaceae bacterium]MDY2867397.1 hypothetical protein [Mesosutterella sp.]